jgi:glycosyltransferase involved in cell wall biosynthesis
LNFARQAAQAKHLISEEVVRRIKPGINVHLYPSDFLHESRIEKISLVLRDLGIFQAIWLVGIATSELPAKEEPNPGVTLYRVGKPTMRRSFIRKMLAFVSYYVSVVCLLRGVPVKCINAHSLSVLPLAILIKLLKGCTVVYDTHELETETHSLTGTRQKFAKLVERTFIGKVDAIFCVSKKISEWYARTYRRPEPVTVLNSPETTPVRASMVLRDKFSLTRDQKIFLYFGILEPGRGIELLLEAFNSTSDINNVMVFVGYGSLVDTISQSSTHGKNVFYLPAVPKREIPAIAASADVGICIVSPSCLSYAYCMPNKLFEYLTSGLPVLVSPCMTLQEFVVENEVGAVLTEMTPAGVLQKIQSLAATDLSAIKTRAVTVARDHSWSVQEQRLKSAYQTIFNHQGHQP